MPTILDYLKQLKRQGVEYLEIDDEARGVLRELYTRGSARKQPVVAPVAQNDSGCWSDFGREKSPRLRLRPQIGAAVKALGTLRDKMVFSVGNPDARLMLVGEAPG